MPAEPTRSPFVARDAAHVAAQLDELAHHVGRRAADGRRDLEHRLHQLRVDLRLELVALRSRRAPCRCAGRGRTRCRRAAGTPPRRRACTGRSAPKRWSSTLARVAGAPERPLPVMSGGMTACSIAITASASISTFQDGSSSDVTTQVAAGRIVAEHLAVRARDLAPVRGVRDEHARAHDVRDRRPGPLERLGDDREAEPRLLVGALGRRRAVGRDRRRPGDVHRRARRPPPARTRPPARTASARRSGGAPSPG